MLKDFLLVASGSFMGGGMRFLISRLLQTWLQQTFPWGTFSVNVIGCLLLGLLLGLPHTTHWLSPSTRLLLTMGFCGGFTTFSAYINDAFSLMKTGNSTHALYYVLGSLLVGTIALFVGYLLSKLF